MPSFALIDSQQLNSGLSNLASTIRAKGSTTGSMAFPTGFVSKINGIVTCEDVLHKHASRIECSAVIIRPYAFYRYSTLTDVSFPNCISIFSDAFAFCYSLKTAYFPACNTISMFAFRACSSLTTVSLPNCTVISRSAFWDCRSLTTLSFPKCKVVADYAFFSCYNLISVYFMGSSFVSLGTGTFKSTPIRGYSAVAGRYGSVFVPASLYSSYIRARNWSVFSSRIVGI